MGAGPSVVAVVAAVADPLSPRVVGFPAGGGGVGRPGTGTMSVPL
ncbi:hypothetical protein AB4Z09_28330 [Rhodococcus sp. TAF43]